jgi:hypothetical protein
MEHKITILKTGVVTSYKPDQLGLLRYYVESLITSNIPFSYTIEI